MLLFKKFYCIEKDFSGLCINAKIKSQECILVYSIFTLCPWLHFHTWQYIYVYIYTIGTRAYRKDK